MNRLIKKQSYIILILFLFTKQYYAQFYIDWYMSNNGGMASFGDLIIGPNANIINNGNFYVLGNNIYISPGAVITGTGNIIFQGASTQQIDANGVSIDCNVIINNANNMSITTLTIGPSPSSNNELWLEANLTFSVGDIITNSSKVVFKNGATYSSVSDNSHINGWCSKIGNTAFRFPIGDGTKHRPDYISAPSVATDVFESKYFYVDPNTTYSVSLKDPTLHHISRCEYWLLNRATGSSNVSVSLSWENVYSCSVTTLPDLRVARWDGSLWRDHGNGGTGGTVASGTIVTSAVVSSFSPFTLASSTYLNPLPIELIYFTATYNQTSKEVDLAWRTASESNNNYFTVERSQDSQNWEFVLQKNGAGNSSMPLSYYDVDKTPYQGFNYYRLKQTDFDGTYTYSGIRDVMIAGNTSNDVFILQPNPANTSITIQWNNTLTNTLDTNPTTITIHNFLGQLVMSESNFNKDIQKKEIDISHLAEGMYYIKVENDAVKQTKNFVKNR